jgi:hypothetical protein
LIVAILTVLALAPGMSAQSNGSREPDVSKANVHLGPLMLKPTMAVTNLGVDTNVFNEADQGSPKHDFTLTLTPQTDLWLRMGRSWVIGNVREDLVWYQAFSSERSANDSARVGWLMPLNRLTFNADIAYLSTRERPGFEIDARSQRSEVAYHGSAEVRAGFKTYIGVRADRKTVKFDSVATFDGVSLRDALNRTVTGEGITVRHQLTPLTGLTLDVGRSEDRFAFSPVRDSDSTNVTLGVKFDPFALIKGSATFGFRNFAPRSANVPEYQGTTASADLSYVAFGRTRLGVQALRDVQYSFAIEEPYYLLTGVSVSLAQQMFGPMDAVGRVGVQQLNYRTRIGTVVAVANRIDIVHSYGGSIGYRAGNNVRIGFDVDRQHRASPVSDRDYQGLRFGTSVTYGY